MNIRDLEYLVAVHDVSNFSKAAEMCNVSQPTLSGQLKKLETDLDAPLMERSTRRVLFTPIGETVVKHARSVLDMVRQIESLSQVDDPLTGDYHIGMLPTVGPFLLPMLMPELTRQYPQMNLYLYELRTDQLVNKLLKGELDAVVLTKQQWSQPVEEISLYTERLLLAVSTKDELSESAEPVSRSVIKNKAVLMLEEGNCLHDQMMDVCNAVGAKADHRYKATSMDTLMHMVMSNTGVTLMPELACQTPPEGVRFVSFKNPKPRREIVMLTRKGSTRSEALALLAETIKSTANEKI